MQIPTIKPVADCAVLVTFADNVSEAANHAVIACDKAIQDAALFGIVESVPALVNVMVVFDPCVTDHARVTRDILTLFPLPDNQAKDAATHVFDVYYSTDVGPDLDAVATACSMSHEAVINAHTSVDYTASMYGYAPGYAYLTGVPTDLQVPRKDAPVRNIPKGSVMIAGPQCLVTTLVMPTGWSILGYTNAAIMRDDPVDPFLIKVGDKVRFRRASADILPAQMADHP